jgi:hypothetical protein
MTRKGFALAALLAVGMIGAGAGEAQAKKPRLEHKASLRSGKATQVCVNPSPGFEPMAEGEGNLAPLTASSETGEGFPTGPSNCSSYLEAAFAIGKPGKPAGPWTGTTRKASWVSFTPSAESSANPTAPAYYIYESDFTASCPTGLGAVALSGEARGDDWVGVFLNGHSLAAYSGNFTGPGGPFSDSATGDFINGTNKLQMVIYDTGGWTGAAYAAKAAWSCAAAL